MLPPSQAGEVGVMVVLIPEREMIATCSLLCAITKHATTAAHVFVKCGSCLMARDRVCTRGAGVFMIFCQTMPPTVAQGNDVARIYVSNSSSSSSQTSERR